MKNSETIYNIYNSEGILIDNNLTGEEVYLNGYTDEDYSILDQYTVEFVEPIGLPFSK